MKIPAWLWGLQWLGGFVTGTGFGLFLASLMRGGA